MGFLESLVIAVLAGAIILLLEYRYIRELPRYKDSSHALERQVVIGLARKWQRIPTWGRVLVYLGVVIAVFITTYVVLRGFQTTSPAMPLARQTPDADATDTAKVSGDKIRTEATVAAKWDQLLSIQLTREASGLPPLPTRVLQLPETTRLADLGAQAQVWGNTDIGFMIGAAKGAGFTWIKFQLPWKDAEGAKGKIAWAPIDGVINELNANGMNILVSVVKAPNWARPSGADLTIEGPPVNLQEYADFVEILAARYRGKIQAIEVWNEPNLWYEWGKEKLNPGRYVDLLCRAYRAIKAVDPGMVVVAGALTPTGVNDGIIAIDDVVYLQRMYDAGMRNCSDAVGAHPYGFNNPPEAKFGYTDTIEPSFKSHRSFFFRETMERYRNVMVANGDASKKIWPTEFGWASEADPVLGYEYARDNTLDEQAQFTVRAYQMAKAWGWVGPMFLWNLNFAITNPGTELAAFSILDSNGRGKPAYSALAAMPK